MPLMRLILRFYPRNFRQSFTEEMLDTFHERQLDYKRKRKILLIYFWLHELLGMLRQLPIEWLTAHRIDEWKENAEVLERNVRRLTALTVAVALQLLLYSYLLPIGPTAAATIGSWLRSVAIQGLLLVIGSEITLSLVAQAIKRQ